MNKYMINKRLLLAAIMLILLSNAVVLARVAFNRFSVQETITLTEREFSSLQEYAYGSSALTLQLQWKTPVPLDTDEPYNYHHSIQVTDANCRAMGFSKNACRTALPANLASTCRRETHLAWLLMEYNGKAYHNDIALLNSHIQQARADNKDNQFIRGLHEQLDHLLGSDSRLYGVALADNARVLEKRITRPQQEFVARVLAGNDYTCSGRLNIQKLFIDKLHVPKEILPDQQALPEKYTLDIAFGNLGEPWITGIRPATQGKNYGN